MAYDPYTGLTGTNRDAALALTNTFRKYGLESLAPQIVKMIQRGWSPDTITVELQNTSEYKRRFAANETRVKKGLPALSPAEYISTENSYREIMSSAGMPVGFYDRQSDFTKWIENDVSPSEVQGRVQVATDLVTNADPATRAYFSQHYTRGDLIAYALDRKRAVPAIEQQYKAAQVGGAAQAQGIGISTTDAERLGKLGVTQSQAQQGFGFVRENLADTQMLGSIYGEDVTQNDLVKEVLEGDAAAGQKRKRLASKERAAFGGSSGQSKTSLSRGSAGAV